MTPAVTTRASGESDELVRVLVWRFRQLARTGFEPELATTVAARLDVDLHEAIDLVERGCPPSTAAQILL